MFRNERSQISKWRRNPKFEINKYEIHISQLAEFIFPHPEFAHTILKTLFKFLRLCLNSMSCQCMYYKTKNIGEPSVNINHYIEEGACWKCQYSISLSPAVRKVLVTNSATLEVCENIWSEQRKKNATQNNMNGMICFLAEDMTMCEIKIPRQFPTTQTTTREGSPAFIARHVEIGQL